jgi:hypothetical protein
MPIRLRFALHSIFSPAFFADTFSSSSNPVNGLQKPGRQLSGKTEWLDFVAKSG